MTITLEPLVAHRGASPYAPENTFAAFDKARALGARSIEFDVMMSSLEAHCNDLMSSPLHSVAMWVHLV